MSEAVGKNVIAHRSDICNDIGPNWAEMIVEVAFKIAGFDCLIFGFLWFLWSSFWHEYAQILCWCPYQWLISEIVFPMTSCRPDLIVAHDKRSKPPYWSLIVDAHSQLAVTHTSLSTSIRRRVDEEIRRSRKVSTAQRRGEATGAC